MILTFPIFVSVFIFPVYFRCTHPPRKPKPKSQASFIMFHRSRWARSKNLISRQRSKKRRHTGTSLCSISNSTLLLMTLQLASMLIVSPSINTHSTSFWHTLLTMYLSTNFHTIFWMLIHPICIFISEAQFCSTIQPSALRCTTPKSSLCWLEAVHQWTSYQLYTSFTNNQAPEWKTKP